MAVNKLALLRYKTLDKCLQNRLRRWTLEDLIEAVSDALYEHEGIHTGVGKRTIQADIQVMRSDKLGYNAPIVVRERRFYTYEDKDYSISQAPVNQADLQKMKEIVGVLKHLNGFNYFDEMSDMITKLENNVRKTENHRENYVQFETNTLLKGIEWINPLYQSIIHKRTLLINYQSFRASQSKQQIYYPYLLKEYRNRWFLIVKPAKSNYLMTLALDRIIDFRELPDERFVKHTGVDFDRYFNDLIGVTKSEKDRAQQVILHIDKPNSPYVLTKPLHKSQQVLKEDETGVIIRIDVVLNFELEREIMGFGDNVKVLAPKLLARKISKRLTNAAAKYTMEN